MAINLIVEARTRSPTTQTRMCNDIDNCQSITIAAMAAATARYCVDRYRPIHVRTDPSAIYNCHGLTFASRRTCISDDKSISQILREDDYVPVQQSDVLPGDIVIYYERGYPEHSGIILTIDQKMHIPVLVCSKWGYLFEAVHHLTLGPFPIEDIRYYRVTR